MLKHYCVSAVRLRSDGNVAEVEWGPLEGQPFVLVMDAAHATPDQVIQAIQRGRMVWASFPTPLGLALGGLLHARSLDGGPPTLELSAGHWSEMRQL